MASKDRQNIEFFVDYESRDCQQASFKAGQTGHIFHMRGEKACIMYGDALHAVVAEESAFKRTYTAPYL